MAKRRPSPSRSSSSRGGSDDAFTAGVLEFVGWVRQNTVVVAVGGVAIVLVVVGGLYWFSERSERMDLAASELEQIQQMVMFESPGEARQRVQQYLDQFDGTPYAVEARLLLAELHLDDNEVDQAISVLQVVAPDYRSALGVQATFLLGVALEEADRWSEAAELYAELHERAEYTFQRYEAGEGLARAQLAAGDTTAALETYESILEGLGGDHPDRSRIEMRIAELSAATSGGA